MVKLPSSLDVYWRYVGDDDNSWVPVTLHSEGGLFTGKITPTPGLSVEIDHPLLGSRTVIADSLPRRTSIRLPSVQHQFGQAYEIDVAPYFTGTNLTYSALADFDDVVNGLRFDGSILSYTAGDKNFSGVISVRAENSSGSITEVFSYEIDDYPPGYDIFLIAGETNAVGRYGPVDGILDVTHPRIFQFGFTNPVVSLASDPLDHKDETANTVGFGLSFAKAFLPTIPENRSILLVPRGIEDGGFDTEYLIAGGDGDLENISAVHAAMLQGSGLNRFRGVLFQQGESDDSFGHAAYQTQLDSLIARWRSSMTGANASTIFLIGEPLLGGARTDPDIVAVQEDTPHRIPRTGFVSSASLVDGGDNVNFNAASQRILGRRYFDQYVAAEKNVLGVPGEITDLVAIVDGTTVDLTWSQPPSGLSPVLDYVVQYKQRTGNLWFTFADGVNPSPGAAVDGLAVGTLYDFRVFPVNALGTGPSSNIVSVATESVTPPAQITDLTGVPDNGRVSLSWSAPSDNGSPITDYLVYYRETGVCEWVLFADGVSTTPSAVVTGLTNGSQYHFMVRAENAVGIGPDSNIYPALVNPQGLVRHWVLGYDNPFMLDTISQAPLIPASTPPTFPGLFLRIADGMNGCVSDTGSDASEFTICCVVRFNSADNGIIFGNLSLTSGAGARLFGGNIEGYITGNSLTTMLETPSLSDWYFLAMSFTEGVGGFDYVGSTLGPTVVSRALTTYDKNMILHFSLGNVAVSAILPEFTFAQGYDFAQFLIFDKALNVAELDEVYDYSAALLAPRSIDLF